MVNKRLFLGLLFWAIAGLSIAFMPETMDVGGSLIEVAISTASLWVAVLFAGFGLLAIALAHGDRSNEL